MFPENKRALKLWQTVATQWRSTGFGVIGLDYNAVFKVAQIIGIKITPALLTKIRVLECEYLKKANAKTKDKEGTDE